MNKHCVVGARSGQLCLEILLWAKEGGGETIGNQFISDANSHNWLLAAILINTHTVAMDIKLQRCRTKTNHQDDAVNSAAVEQGLTVVGMNSGWSLIALDY